MGAAENRAAVAAMYEAFGTGDIEALLGANAPDAVWTVYSGNGSPLAGEYKGVDAIGGFFAKIPETVDMTRFDIAPLAAEGDVVVARGEQTYTVKATGKTVEGPILHVFTFGAAGKVARFDEYEVGVGDAYLS
jgi:ketosteroid isomerase-like protein